MKIGADKRQQMRRRNESEYRFIRPTGRPIQVVFPNLSTKRYSTGTTNMVEAVEWAVNFMRERGWEKGSPTFEEYARYFFVGKDGADSEYRLRDRSLGREHGDYYYAIRQRKINNYLLPSLGKYRLNAITPPLIEMTIRDLKGVKGPMSGQSKKDAYCVLKLIMTDAYRKGIISSNPASADLVKLPATAPVRAVRALTIYEQSVLFPLSADRRVEIFGSIFWAAYFSIMYSTGFRPGEVRGIEVSDLVSCTRGVVVDISHSVPSTTDRREERVKTTGTGFSTRTGVLDPVATELVKRLVVGDGLTADDPLFLKHSNRAKYISDFQGNSHFRKACRTAGLTDAAGLTQYCIRHTFGTMHKGALGDETLADLMGHVGGKMLETYDNRDKAQRVALADRERDRITARAQESITESFYDKYIKEA